MRRRRFAMLVLALGAVGGYASGFRSLHQCSAHRDTWERRVAKVCVDAARGQTKSPAAAPAE